MMKQPWMFVSILVAAAVPWAACSSSSGSGTTSTATTGSGGHTAASASHAASTSTGVTTGSGGSGGAGACGGILQGGDPCDDCVLASCCPSVTACANDSTMNCGDCLTGADTGTDCTASPTAALLMAVQSCVQSMCATQCAAGPTPACDAPAAPATGACYTAPSGTCNPVSNAGCTAAGASCDDDPDGGFTCYTDPPNTAAICAACDDDNGPACLPGSSCTQVADGTTVCVKFCCTDADCGSGTCDLTQVMQTTDPSVGLCVAKPDGG